MKYAIIENNEVVNIAKAETALLPNWIQSNTAKIGDSYDPETGEFTTPPVPVVIPQSLTRAQTKIALHSAGLLQPVLDYVAAADTVTQIAWEEASEFKRSNPLIAAAAGSLGLTANDIDNLFIAGAQINLDA